VGHSSSDERERGGVAGVHIEVASKTARDRQMAGAMIRALLFAASVVNFQASFSLALDDDLAVQRVPTCQRPN